jgi:hypothetical protein
VVSALRGWVTDPAEREKAVEACRRVARPNSSIDIAHVIGQKLGLTVTSYQ